MGDFCIATGLTPQIFWESTREEYDAIIRAYNRRNTQRG